MKYIILVLPILPNGWSDAEKNINQMASQGWKVICSLDKNCLLLGYEE